MRPPTSRLRRALRPAAAFAAAGLLFAACGDDDATDEAAEVVEPVEESDELLSPQLDGLEVTVTGNVTEVMAGDGFQIDKDGLGEEGDAPPDNDVAVDFEDDYFLDNYDLYDFYDDHDYDYYDFEYYTAFDIDWDDFDERSVVVVTPGGSSVELGQAIQVNGTLRYFDESALETVYDMELSDDLWGSYEQQYVIVADAVKSVPADRESATSSSAEGTPSTTAPPSGESDDGTTTSTTPGDEATTSTTEGEEETTTSTTADEG